MPMFEKERKLSFLLTEGKKRLKEAGAGEYALDAALLLMDAAGISKVQLYTDRERMLSEAAWKKYENNLSRREQGEPLQYILGRCEFMGIPFLVRPGVLIPRPDTEIVVEQVLLQTKEKNWHRVLEIGSGSGCIPVSLAYYSDLFVTSVDISLTALQTAEENARKNGVADKIRFLNSNLFTALERGSLFDVIVSNPPYIPSSSIKGLMREVQGFEPRIALDGGEDGLYFYREITKRAADFLKADGGLFFEIGQEQAEKVSAILEENGFYDIHCKKDLAGLDRVVYGKWRQ